MKIFKYIFILGLVFLAHDASAFTCGVLPAGGNWNAATTWHSCNGTYPQNGDDVVATSTSGNLAINVGTFSLKSIDFTGYTGTLSGGSTLIVRGLAATTQNVTFSSGMTITWGGASAVLRLALVATTAEIDLTTNGKNIPNLQITNGLAGTVKLMDNYTAPASEITSFVLGTAGTLDMNGKTISGYNSQNRLLISSSVIGTQRTITVNGGTFAYADFSDIALNTPTNLSAITGLSGDAGGNSNITFTTATTTYWIGNSGNTDDTAEWSWGSGLAGSTSRVPLPQDNCIFDANSFSGTGFTVTNNQSRICAGIDFSAVGTDNPTFSYASNLVLSTYGSLILHSGMAIGNVAGVTLDFLGRGTHIIDLQGASVPKPITMDAYGGTYTLASAFTSASTFTMTSGTFTLGGYNFTGTLFSVSNSAANTVNMGNSTMTITGAGNFWVMGAAANFNADTSTLKISNTTATAKNFAGNGKTYYNVDFSGDNIIVTGANTFNDMGVNNAGDAGTNGLILTIGTATSTITSISTNATTTSDRAIIKSSTAGTIAGLQANTGGNICVDYLSIKDIRAYGTSSFYAGANSLDVSGNSGWIFSACPNLNLEPRSANSSNVKISSLPLAVGAPGWYDGTWTYRKKISVDPQKVGSTTTAYLNNFPMLVSVIDSDLKVTGSGGKVASSTAGDIIFTAGDGITLLDFEIEKYVSTTGEMVAWIKIPFLSSTSTTPIYMYVGNTGAAYLQNAPGVWDSNFKGVWHLLSNGTTVSVDDSTGVNSGTNVGAPLAIVAKIDGGVSYDGTSNYTITPAMGSMSQFTISMWVKPTGASDEAFISKYFNDGTGNSDWLMQVVTNRPAFQTWVGGYQNLIGDTVIPSGVWTQVVYTFDASFVKRIYINGSVDPSTYTLGAAVDTHSQPVGFGAYNLGWAYTKKAGNMDEIRISSSVRSADWIKTEYNNQSNPNTFYSYGGLENYSGRVNSSGGVTPAVKVRGGVKFR